MKLNRGSASPGTKALQKFLEFVTQECLSSDFKETLILALWWDLGAKLISVRTGVYKTIRVEPWPWNTHTCHLLVTVCRFFFRFRCFSPQQKICKLSLLLNGHCYAHRLTWNSEQNSYCDHSSILLKQDGKERSSMWTLEPLKISLIWDLCHIDYLWSNKLYQYGRTGLFCRASSNLRVSCNPDLPHAYSDLFQNFDKIDYTQLPTSGRDLLSTLKYSQVRHVSDRQQSSQMAHLPDCRDSAFKGPGFHQSSFCGSGTDNPRCMWMP